MLHAQVFISVGRGGMGTTPHPCRYASSSSCFTLTLTPAAGQEQVRCSARAAHVQGQGMACAAAAAAAAAALRLGLGVQQGSGWAGVGRADNASPAQRRGCSRNHASGSTASASSSSQGAAAPALGVQQHARYPLAWIQPVVVCYALLETMSAVVASLARHALACGLRLLLASQWSGQGHGESEHG